MDEIKVQVTDEIGTTEYSTDVPNGLPNDAAILIGFGLLFTNDWSSDEDLEITVYRNGEPIPPPEGWQEV